MWSGDDAQRISVVSTGLTMSGKRCDSYPRVGNYPGIGHIPQSGGYLSLT